MLSTEQLYQYFRQYPEVATDSRRVGPQSLFFALKGEKADGNRYAAAALEQGAAYAVVDDRAAAVSERYLLVEDVLTSLQELAAYHRLQLEIPILAITGSNGKTTTKELVRRVAECRWDNVGATKGNFNNHIGVPLTLLSLESSCEFAVIEMGANHCGEIARLCEIARPDFGLITNIGKSHLEGFGGEEGIRRGKGELFDFLDENGGTAFYLEESADLREMIGRHKNLIAIPYSPASMGLGIVAANPLKVRMPLPEGQECIIETSLEGDYNIYNVSAALAIARYFDIKDSRSIAAVESYVPDNNRSQRIDTPHNTLYMDAYNANPSSMEASLRNFASIDTPQPKTAILGDMLELGSYSAGEHQRMVRLAKELGLSDVLFTGPFFNEAAAGYGHAFATTAELEGYLKAHPVRGHAVLLKGSRGMHLETIAALL